jgi:hypothetical protein
MGVKLGFLASRKQRRLMAFGNKVLRESFCLRMILQGAGEIAQGIAVHLVGYISPKIITVIKSRKI